MGKKSRILIVIIIALVFIITCLSTFLILYNNTNTNKNFNNMSKNNYSSIGDFESEPDENVAIISGENNPTSNNGNDKNNNYANLITTSGKKENSNFDPDLFKKDPNYPNGEKINESNIKIITD
ncbi:hypothetical protein SDC9_46163 [bioreactor metagenome]|uniref:Uncharacterized protein n=1 Tax=bioreactor metagenome TaxID=1076179 RepID=A0A644W887_9ZZZZ|nr:hypothetical protein [Methanobrevibacter sp.]MEA4957825.1 hypothetical protein [Methanobrevibacter sp.]